MRRHAVGCQRAVAEHFIVLLRHRLHLAGKKLYAPGGSCTCQRPVTPGGGGEGGQKSRWPFNLSRGLPWLHGPWPSVESPPPTHIRITGKDLQQWGYVLNG